jgi:hypothetical protein
MVPWASGRRLENIPRHLPATLLGSYNSQLAQLLSPVNSGKSQEQISSVFMQNMMHTHNNFSVLTAWIKVATVSMIDSTNRH